jgi:hypothetical protein
MRNDGQNLARTGSEPVGIRPNMSLPDFGHASSADSMAGAGQGRVTCRPDAGGPLESPEFLGEPPGPPPPVECDNLLGDPAAFVDPGITAGVPQPQSPQGRPPGRRMRQFRSASNVVFAPPQQQLPPPDEAEMALYTFT